MSRTSYFDQECPTCGRSLRVRVEYLGKNVTCRHCRGKFVACDPESSDYPPEDSGLGLLKRANALLSSTELQKVRPR